MVTSNETQWNTNEEQIEAALLVLTRLFMCGLCMYLHYLYQRQGARERKKRDDDNDELEWMAGYNDKNGVR